MCWWTTTISKTTYEVCELSAFHQHQKEKEHYQPVQYSEVCHLPRLNHQEDEKERHKPVQ